MNLQEQILDNTRFSAEAAQVLADYYSDTPEQPPVYDLEHIWAELEIKELLAWHFDEPVDITESEAIESALDYIAWEGATVLEVTGGSRLEPTYLIK